MSSALRPRSRRQWFRLLSRFAVLAPARSLAEQLIHASSPKTNPRPTPVQFTDIAVQAGLGTARNYSGSPDNKQFLLEEMGCGVALFDYDDDGWLDIFFANGTTIEGTEKATSYLFHNNRDGTFTDVSRKAGIVHSGWGQGCCVGDYDNDGREDLFVSYWGKNVLYRNNGDGTFTNVAAKAGVEGDRGRWGAGCCFLDYDRDGHLDLFVANYVRFEPDKAPRPGESPLCRYNEISVPCGPQGFGGGSNVLYRNRGDGTFEDVSEKSGIANPRGSQPVVFTDSNWRPTGSYGMGAVAADFDNDGWPDIYVAGDSAPSLLYRNNRDGTFREVGVEAGCAFDENGVAMSGMGVGAGDYDGDGWFDIVRTNFSDQITTLYRNNGNGTFQDVSIGGGLGMNRKYLGFGAGFADIDNDGWKDIFLANGHVYPQIAGRNLHISYKQPKLVYRNLRNGRFEDVSARSGPGISAPHVSRGCAFGDFDNDGDIDVVVSNLDGRPSLLRNNGGNRNNWMIVKCIGTRSNRSAIGARVRLTCGGRTQVDEVMSGSSYYSQNDLRLHFGLGSAARADRIDVQWPSGLQDSAADVPSNQLVVFVEGKGVMKTAKFRER
jgi:hypothetical protein